MTNEFDFPIYDLNWFFLDKWRRICHAASAGGALPNQITLNMQSNDEFNRIVYSLKEDYKAVRNPNLSVLLERQGVQDVERYIQDFEMFARKGLYSFDKFAPDRPEDTQYFLVAYPQYDPQVNPYPITKLQSEILPRINVHIRKDYKRSVNLISYFKETNVLITRK